MSMQPTITVRNSAAAGVRIAELWRYRGLFKVLVSRNLKVKYQRSVLGFVWTLLNPLLTIGVLAAVFTHVVKIPVPNYWAFLLSGYFVWNFVQMTLSTGTYIFGEHSQLTRSVAFPLELLIFASTAARLVEFALEMSIVLVALVVFHHHGVPASFALLPLLVLIQTAIAVGLFMGVATLAVFYADIQHALPALLLVLFYLSPVFYPLEMVPENVHAVYLLNPFASLLTLFHTVVYKGELPSLALLGTTGAIALAAILIGYAVFNRHKRLFAEIL